MGDCVVIVLFFALTFFALSFSHLLSLLVEKKT